MDVDNGDNELRRLRSEAAHLRDDTRRQVELIARLRKEAGVREEDIEALRQRLDDAEHEIEDLRAIRDALTPAELPQRPGLDLAAAFLPATEQVSGDFYLVAEGPQDATVLVVGDVVGHGLTAARRAAFVRTVFVVTAPFSDDPCRLLSWANAALVERAGEGIDFVTAACLSYLPEKRCLRWAYAGHPSALWLDEGEELVAPNQGLPLGLREDLGAAEGSRTLPEEAGVLLYTDGLTEARCGEEFFGLEGVTKALRNLERPSASEAINILRTSVTDFSTGALSDDLCLLAARLN